MDESRGVVHPDSRHSQLFEGERKMAVATAPLSDAEWRKLISKPIVKSSDMSIEMTSEIVDLVAMAVDKFIAVKNYEASAQLVKNTLDKKFGASWHCAVGEGFGYEITHQHRNCILVYYGTVGVLAFKC